MNKKYWVWETPETKAWKELSGREFYALIKSPQPQKRYFVRLPNDDCPEANDIYIESDKRHYQDYLVEKRHKQYLRDGAHDIQVLSVGDISIVEDCNQADGQTPINLDFNTEDRAIQKILLDDLRNALPHLSADERQLIAALYSPPLKTRSQVAIERGVTQQAISKQEKKILDKLNLLVVKGNKSVQ